MDPVEERLDAYLNWLDEESSRDDLPPQPEEPAMR